jgi:hypothetical protein
MSTNIAIAQQADGSVVVDLSTRAAPPPGLSGKEGAGDGFDDNLIDALDYSSVNSIVEEVHQGIEADVQSRQQWVDNYNEGLSLLGLILEKPAQLNNNTSTVRHPLLSWAIIQGQALANGEMLPAQGPVKVENAGSLPDDAADAMERDMNFYLKTTAKEYYPDTDRALYLLYYGGTIFKKVFKCPLRRRPVSEAVYLPDLIVSNDATTLSQARRVTHQIEGYARNRILQMQDAGWWAEVPVPPPTQNPSKSWTAIAKIIGINPTTTITADHTHTVRECYTWIDLERWGYKDPFAKDKMSGLELPYVLTYDRDSRKAYRLSRNWRQSDGDNGYLFARQRFAKWGMIPGLGYLDLGFLNLLGNTQMAVTALERILVDAGIYSIFPGGVRVKGMRMETNEIRPAPGEFPEIDTGGMPIAQAIMPLPFKGPAAEVLALLQHLEGLGDKMAGTATLQTKEGIKDVPVGTLMAAIEQSATVQIAVHKRLHNGQKDELMLLRDEFRDMGEEGYQLLRQRDKNQPYTAEQLFSASLIPASDPEMPAHIHRFMQATALESLSSQHPDLYDLYRVQKRILEMGRINNPDDILVPPPPVPAEAPPDPNMIALQMQAELQKQELALKAEDVKGKQRIAEMKVHLDKWIAEQEMAAEQAKIAAEAEADAETKTLEAAQDGEAKDKELDLKTLEAAQKQEAEDKAREADLEAKTLEAAQKQQLEMDKTEMQLDSAERVAAMHDQTTLIVEGIRADDEPTEENPTKDKKSGP